MIETREDCIAKTLPEIARLMASAAISAPKSSGNDSILSWVLTGDDKHELAEHMRRIGEETGVPIFPRDADNVDASECVVIIGVKCRPFGLDHCGLCGFENCGALAKAGGRCVFNVTDLGIAVGSAVSVAADHRVDNRVMYTVGRGAMEMDFMDQSVKICFGIPLSVTSKSIYYDRGPGSVLV